LTGTELNGEKERGGEDETIDGKRIRQDPGRLPKEYRERVIRGEKQVERKKGPHTEKNRRKLGDVHA